MRTHLLLLALAAVAFTVTAQDTGTVLYGTSFETQADFDACSTIMVKDDPGTPGRTWAWSSSYKAAQIMPKSNVGHDDYLVSPALQLEAGTTYTLSATLRQASRGAGSAYRLVAGNAPTVEGLSNELLAAKATTKTAVLEQVTFTPAASGTYYFAVHAFFEGSAGNVILDDWQVTATAGADAVTPGPVTDLAVTPDIDCALQAVITFKAPTLDADSVPLTGLSAVTISRGADVVKTFETPEPGAELTFTDTLTQRGLYEYSVVASNDDAQSPVVKATAFVGPDVPVMNPFTDAFETATPGTVRLSWQPVTKDINGKNLRPEDITYIVAAYQNDMREPKSVFARDLADTTYTVKLCEPETEQSYQFVFVYAVHKESGYDPAKSRGSTPVMWVGKPEKMPIRDSFEHGYYSWEYLLQNASNLFVNSPDTAYVIPPFDNDNGYMAVTPKYAQGGPNYCKVAVPENAQSPVLTFNVYNDIRQGANDTQVSVWHRDASMPKAAIDTFTVSELGDSAVAGWRRVVVDLSAHKGQSVNIQIGVTAGVYSSVAIDNLQVYDIADATVTVADIQAPTSVKPGETFDVALNIENRGARDASDVRWQLCKDNGVIAEGSADVKAGDLTRVTIPVTLTTLDKAQTLLTANIDGEAANSRTVQVMDNAYPEVRDLVGTVLDHEVTLGWNAPETVVPFAITDDFEAYTPWDYKQAGDWRFVDKDGYVIWEVYNPRVYRYVPEDYTYSWIVFDGDAYDFQRDYFKGHSGVKFMHNYTNEDDGDCLCDDWAVSPRLSGRAQKVSLWAKAYSSNYPEDFDFYYTTEEEPVTTKADGFYNIDKSQWTRLGSEKNIGVEWREFAYDVPEGAKHFAIVGTSAGTSWSMWVDDVTYEPAANASLVGYDVYRDGQRINDAVITDTSYKEASLRDDKDHTYAVTAVYSDGLPSRPVSVSVLTSGIDQLDGSASFIAISGGIGGITVMTSAATSVEIYDLRGAKALSQTVGAGTSFVPVPAGMYIARAGGRTAKVLVR